MTKIFENLKKTAYLPHLPLLVIPEGAVNTASVGKFFTEKEQNFLREKNCKARLSI